MKSKQYRAEVKTRAVELLIESQKDYPSLWAAIQAIAPKFGCTPETLRSWGSAGIRVKFRKNKYNLLNIIL